jgi:cobalt-zinc-cadmium efflux system protein
MEGTPPEVDIGAIEKRLMSLPGVTAIHDLHVWTLTSGLDAMSCHIIISDILQSKNTLQAASQIMREEFRVSHTTIQIEDQDIRQSSGHDTRI